MCQRIGIRALNVITVCVGASISIPIGLVAIGKGIDLFDKPYITDMLVGTRHV